MKYLLIDGNNLAIRSAFANEELSNQDGIPTGVHYGVFNSLMLLKEKFPYHQFLVVWDGKSKRRMEESQEGVKQGLIKSAYKENRKTKEGEETPKPLLDFYSQAPYLKRGIEQTGIPQIRMPSFEADDVIASYCTKLSDSAEEITVVTSDKDYFQILSDSIQVWDGMKNKMITEELFKEEFEISPQQHIDCGALMGDTGDNIFGIPSVGEKTALKLIKEYHKWQNIYTEYDKIYGDLRKKFPDLVGAKDFEKLKNIKTKSEKLKYPEIFLRMPYTGVVLAVEEKRINQNISKTVLMTLMFGERVKLAYSLKKMDSDIDDLPDIEKGSFNGEKLLEYFDYYNIESLKDKADMFN